MSLWTVCTSCINAAGVDVIISVIGMHLGHYFEDCVIDVSVVRYFKGIFHNSKSFLPKHNSSGHAVMLSIVVCACVTFVRHRSLCLL